MVVELPFFHRDNPPFPVFKKDDQDDQDNIDDDSLDSDDDNYKYDHES